MTLRALPLVLSLAVLAGCAGLRGAGTAPAAGQAAGEAQRIAQLSAVIVALGTEVDADEARRAAEVAVRYPLQLAAQYQLTTPPLWHNTLVNLGVKPRGLCVHWTRDMLIRLRELRLSTLTTHWGVANAEAVFRIEHSTAIIGIRGEPMESGVVLDPWRDSGRLFWSKVGDDTRYRWRPLAEVQAERRRKQTEVAESRAYPTR